MYASIDLVSHTLAQILKRHKDKVQSKRKNEKVRARIRVLKADRLLVNHILLPYTIQRRIPHIPPPHNFLLC
jgi:hypothetical protein